MTVGEAMADPRVIFYILFGLLLLVCMAVDMLVYQARIARSRGTLTPWQVLLMSLRTGGNGFEVSSRAEPFPDVDASLEGLSDEEIQQLHGPLNGHPINAHWARRMPLPIQRLAGGKKLR